MLLPFYHWNSFSQRAGRGGSPRVATHTPVVCVWQKLFDGMAANGLWSIKQNKRKATTEFWIPSSTRTVLDTSTQTHTNKWQFNLTYSIRLFRRRRRRWDADVRLFHCLAGRVRHNRCARYIRQLYSLARLNGHWYDGIVCCTQIHRSRCHRHRRHDKLMIRSAVHFDLPA